MLARGYAVAQRRSTGRCSAGAADFPPGRRFHLRVRDGDGAGARGGGDHGEATTEHLRCGRPPARSRRSCAGSRRDDVDLDAALALFEEGVARLRAARGTARGGRGAGEDRCSRTPTGALRSCVSISTADAGAAERAARTRRASGPTGGPRGVGRRGSSARSPAGMGEALAYALRSPGKRVRPALVHRRVPRLRRALAGRSPASPRRWRSVHTYSLVHDDLPCMDDDDLRRGRPTTHRAFDVPTATRVGLPPGAGGRAGARRGAPATSGSRRGALGAHGGGALRGRRASRAWSGGQWLDLEAERRAARPARS